MGTWEVGIYQNDTSADVKSDYVAKLKQGKSDEEALQAILYEYSDDLEDEDCKYDVILGLAGVMWDKGRLTKEIKDMAFAAIEEDKVSERWLSEKIRKEREKVLDKFKAKLEGEMPERKKVSVHKPYKLGWEEGQVYTFQIQEEIKGYEQYIGWYVLFYVDKIWLDDWQVRGVYDELADLFFFLTEEKPTCVEDIYNAKNICFYRGKKGNRYRVYLCEVRKKERPVDLILLGKCNDFKYPENDKIDKGCFFWLQPVCTRDILWGYGKQLKYEAEIAEKQ